MEAQHIQELLLGGLDNCEVTVSGEGSHFDIVVVGEVFAGLRPVKKQQIVYAVLKDLIADGSVHAVNIQTLTPAEWQGQQT